MSTTTFIVVALMAALALAAVSSIVAPALAVSTGKGNPPAESCADAAAPLGGSARGCGQAHAPIVPGPQ